MATDFFFETPTFEIQPLKAVAVFKWQRLKNPDVQHAIEEGPSETSSARGKSLKYSP